MKKYKNILTYVENTSSDIRAVEAAITLARHSGGNVVARKVLDLAIPEVREWGPDGWEAFCNEVLQAEQQNLEQRVAGLTARGVSLTARVSIGRPSLELIQDVLEHGHDLVIKVAAGKGGGRRIAFGSTGLHLVRKSPAPVWLLPHAPLPPKRILAAIHPGIDGDEARYALSQRILQHASALASSMGAELHVAHVHEGPPRGLTDVSFTAKLMHRVGLTEQHIVDRARRLLSPLPAQAQLHLLRGESSEVLPTLAHSLEAHTLVLGSLGRTGIAGLLIGDLAEELLGRIDCGVFCIKPAGFDTPVGRRKSMPPQPHVPANSAMASGAAAALV